MPSRIQLCGAASVIDALVGPQRAAVEQATGVEIAVEKSNAGRGLKDLIEGKCDAALVSASLESCLEAARTAGLTLPAPADLKMDAVSSSEVVFVVHPANPVKALTWAQLRDVHTGKVTSWKELGGKDLPIAVFTDAAASATRGLVKQVVMGNAEYAASARAVAQVKEVATEVARNEAGIGALGLEFVTSEVRVVESQKVLRPLAFVTRGEPSEPLRKVIEGYRKAAGRK
jgi:phosphate transport system substrate-binding protein